MRYLEGLEAQLVQASRELYGGDAVAPRRRSYALAVGVGAAAAAVAAGIAVALVGLGTEAQRAYAGWSASPTTPARGQTQAAKRTCGQAASRLISGMKSGRVETPSTMRAPLPRIAPTEWSTVLSDTRGRYTTMILRAQKGAVVTACRASMGFSHPFVMTESVGTRTGPLARDEVKAVADVESTGQSREQGGTGRPFTILDGHVGRSVTGLTFTLKDGTQVQASVEKGWFLVWWPGRQGALVGERVVTVVHGTVSTQTLNYP